MVKAIFHPNKIKIYQPGINLEQYSKNFNKIDPIKLSSNENPLGASPKSILAAKKSLLNLHLYHDASCSRLKKMLAEINKIKENQITVGNGSENILEIISKSFLAKNDTAIVPQYVFATIPLILSTLRVKILTISLDNWKQNVNKTIEACKNTGKIVYIVNPGNPIGTYLTQDELKFLLKSIPKNTLVVIDEAYKDYVLSSDYPDTIKLLMTHKNLIITRTFSKIYGLAGLRIGYSISSQEIANILNCGKMPFNNNVVGVEAALAALSDVEHTKNSVQTNNVGRNQILTELQKMKIEYLPSFGNFITIDLKKDAQKAAGFFLQNGIIIRPLSSYGLKSYIRVTIGKKEQNIKFLNVIKMF